MLGLKLSDIESASIPKSAIATHCRFFIQRKMQQTTSKTNAITQTMPWSCKT